MADRHFRVYISKQRLIQVLIDSKRINAGNERAEEAMVRTMLTSLFLNRGFAYVVHNPVIRDTYVREKNNLREMMWR